MNHKLSSWFFILMLFSGMILIFSPNMMVSGSYTSGYYAEDFEDQDVLKTNITFVQGGDIWGTLTGWNSQRGRSADDHWYVSNYGGGRAYKCVATGPGGYNDAFWMEVNFSIDNVTYLYIDSDVLLGTPPDAWNAGFHIYLNNSAGGTIATMGYFWTGPSSGNPHLSLTCDSSTAIVKASDNVTTDFAITLFDNKSVYIIAHGYKNSTDAGVNVSKWFTTVAGFDDISVMAINVQALAYKARHYYFDNLSVYDVMGGDVTVNVYNESSPSVAIPNWDIYITDENGIILNSSTGNNNPLVIDIPIFGPGERFFYVNASGYDTRVYYAEIVRGVNYTLDVFLPSSALANIYTLIVVDDTDLYHPIYINDAEMTITRYINGSFHEMASGFTDYSGRFYVSLIPGVAYYVNISATGYADSTHTYVPSVSVFEHTFHLTADTPTSKSYDMFWENVSIDISMVSAGCMMDGNITITYLDSNSSTNDTEMQLWEVYGLNNTLLNTWVNTSNSFFNINGSINTTRMHYMVLYFNNTADFMVSQPIIILIPNVDSPFCEGVTPFDLDDRIDKVIGPFTIDGEEVPWPTIIGIIIPIIILVSFGPFNTGIGIIGCGISMAMLQGFLDTLVSVDINWGIAGLGVFIIVIGIMYVMTKGTGVDHL